MSIEEQLLTVNDYIRSIVRNPEKGWWEIEFAIPMSWEYSETKLISCELLHQSDVGKVILIAPKKQDSITVDNLVEYISIVIKTNEEIVKKELEFTNRMADLKLSLENEAKMFYEELENMKKKSFNTILFDSEKKPYKKNVTNNSENSVEND